MTLLVVINILLFGGAAITAFLAIFVWRKKDGPDRRYFAALLATIAVYSVLVAVEFITPDLGGKIFWSKFQYIPGVALAPLWLLFSLSYGNYSAWITRRRMVLLWIVPVVTLLFAFTNERHHLVWTNVYLIAGDPSGFAAYAHGPVVWVLMWYSYFLIAAASLIMIRQAFRSATLYPWQTVALVGGALSPWLGNVLSATGLGPLQGFELGALSFAVSGMLFSWGIYRYQSFQMTSVAYDTILASMGEAVVIADRQNRIAYLNSAAEWRLGLNRSQVGVPLVSTGVIGVGLATTESETQVLSIPTHDTGGSARTFLEVSRTNLTPNQGHGSHKVLIVRDITERKAAEDELLRRQESMEEFNRLLAVLNQVSNELATVSDLDDLCRKAVELGCSQLGFDRLGIWFIQEGELVARGSFGVDESGVIRDERQILVIDWDGWGIERLMRKDTAYEYVAGVEIEWDGKSVGHGDRAVAAMWDGARAIGYITTDNLLTQKPIRDEHCQLLALYANSLGHLCSIRHGQLNQRKLEEELYQAQKMEAIGQLAGGVAHDFNNLLTAILGFSDMALTDMGPTESNLRESLLQIRAAGERAQDLTRHLLAFGRKQTLSFRNLDLNESLRRFERMLKRIIGEDITFTIELDAAECLVNADSAQIEQVIMNLAVNARDAMPKGGALTITTSHVSVDDQGDWHNVGLEPGPYILVTVSDTGCGMDEETQKRIFEPFFTTKELGKGTGLGLAMVYGIVKQHDGYITVSSELDRGTSIRMFLPESKGVVRETVRVDTTLVPSTGTETILLVEDDAVVRRLVFRQLAKLGYDIIEANNGHDAIRLARTHSRIDLLLTDVIMPELSGRDVYDQLSIFHPETKVLYMSGYPHDVVSNHGILNEGIHFLEKPFTHQTLAETIREVLRQPQLTSP